MYVRIVARIHFMFVIDGTIVLYIYSVKDRIERTPHKTLLSYDKLSTKIVKKGLKILADSVLLDILNLNITI